MAIQIAATPVLEGSDAVRFLKRMEFWAAHPVTLKNVEVNADVVDAAVQAVRARRAARLKAAADGKQKQD